jgi:hypothetical protein
MRDRKGKKMNENPIEMDKEKVKEPKQRARELHR